MKAYLSGKVGLALLGACLAGVVARADCTVNTSSFSYTGGTQTYTVPTGTDYIIVKAWGGGGGCQGSCSGNGGDYVCASYNVTPGQTCTISVGGGGSGNGAGGWPDGGNCQSNNGGGAGGSSIVATPNGTVTSCGGGGSCSGSVWGGSGSSSNCSGSYFNGSIQHGGSGSCGGYSDSNYPGNNCGYGGAGGGSHSGCSGGVTIIACQRPPTITSAGTASGNQNESFSYSITASDTPTSYSATGLPPGLAVSSSTGLISGTPSAAGTYNATVCATDGGGTGSASVVFTIAQTYTLTIASSPSAGGSFSGSGVYAPGTVVSISETPASSYRAAGWGGTNAANAASSSSPSTTIVMNGNYSLTAEFVRQAILTVTGGSGGTTSGTGTYDIGSTATITATPSANYVFSGWSGTGVSNVNATATTVTITGNEIVTASFVQPPAFTSGNATQALVVGQPYSFQVSATNASRFSATNLPSGLTITSSGLISGTPRSAGSWSGSVTATGAGGSASQTLPFTVYPQPSITSSLTASGDLNESFSYTITASGAPTSYAASGLPSGLTVNASTGVISGTPTQSGTFRVTISAGEDGATGSATLSLNVVPTYTLTITPSTADGGTYSGAGTYPAGAVVAIAETPNSGFRAAGWTGPDGSATASPNSASTTIVMNGSESLVANFVQQVILTVTSSAGGTVSGSGTYDVGAVVPISATAASGYVFTGWSGTGISNDSANSTTVTLTGNELVAASFEAPPVLTQTGSQILVVGQAYSETVAATNAPTFSASGLPPGLSISADTGEISGTPTSVGSWSTTVTAANAAGSASETVSFTAYGVPSITSAATASANTAGAFSYTITASNSPTIYGATNLPPGLSLDPSTGVISGTPTSAGTYEVSLTAANAGATGSATVAITVTQMYTLSISGSPSAGGTFSGAGTYAAGTTVNVSEAPAYDYRAAGWGGANGGSTASPTSASTTIVMNGNYSLVADFAAQGTLAVDAGTGGTATGGGAYDLGTTVTITATPSTNYLFSDWSGGTTASASSASTTVTITGDETVTANFSVAPQPPTVTITAASTAYTGSPFSVSSTAAAPDDNLTLHTIEWLSPSGTVYSNSYPASGGTDTQNLGITFSATGTWTLRAGASVDNGNTWVYSPSVPVAVTSGITTYTVETMAVPAGANLNWYSTSPVVTETYQVQHTNP